MYNMPSTCRVRDCNGTGCIAYSVTVRYYKKKFKYLVVMTSIIVYKSFVGKSIRLLFMCLEPIKRLKIN